MNDDGSPIFRVGLMMFSETGEPNNNVEGGYVRAAVRDLTEDNKTLYMNLLNGLHIINDKSNGGKAGMTMMEAYYYFAGQNPRSGNNKVKTDYTSNTAGSAATDAVYALPENALPQSTGTRAAGPPYNSPVIDGSCGQNFIIYHQQRRRRRTTARQPRGLGFGTELLQAEGGDTTTIPISPAGSMSHHGGRMGPVHGAEPVRHHHLHGRRKQGHHRPGAGVDGVAQEHGRASAGASTSTSAPPAPAMRSSPALQTIFSEIQAVNTVFASVSLPVSVNTEGTYLNQIYIGMFRPDTRRDSRAGWAT